ncbi:sensor histidine kinase [Fimbriiglobus ruber]|uniref:sensor histidine kinase n=1 Tax=Fimbriiglobus ruber TaxID=1908690 RepID=UPI003B84610B
MGRRDRRRAGVREPDRERPELPRPGPPGADRGRGGPVSRGADGVTYLVRDNGLGISPAYQHKIFQAFQRVHPDVAAGEGMGLAIVRRVADRHRGRVWVESAPGAGSTFFVTFPFPPAGGPAGSRSVPVPAERATP